MKYFNVTKNGKIIDTLVCGNKEKIRIAKSFLLGGMKWEEIIKKEYKLRVLKMKYPTSYKVTEVKK